MIACQTHLNENLIQAGSCERNELEQKQLPLQDWTEEFISASHLDLLLYHIMVNLYNITCSLSLLLELQLHALNSAVALLLAIVHAGFLFSFWVVYYSSSRKQALYSQKRAGFLRLCMIFFSVFCIVS